MREQKIYRLLGFTLGVLVYFMVFWQLDNLPIIQWDESRFAINALEISQHGNPLIPLYEGNPDFWNSKPPLNAALQAASMRVLGYNSLAVRLPAALAVLGTIMMLAFFVQKLTKDAVTAMLVVLALLASPGYWGIHIARTGDADALLVCFQTMYILSFFCFVWFREKKWLWGIFLGLLFAGLTKGIAAFLPLPALGLWALLSAVFHRRNVFKKLALYLVGIGAIGLLAVFYAYREIVTPGYIDAVSFNEWGGRFMREEGSGQAVSVDRWFYVRNLFRDRLFPIVYIWPLMAFSAITLQDKDSRLMADLALLVILIHLLLISAATTHHHWYDAPIYPMMAIVMGMGVKGLYVYIHRKLHFSWVKIAYITLLGGVFAFPIFSTLQKYQDFERVRDFESEGSILMEIEKYVPVSDTVFVVKAVEHPFHWDQILFYQKTNQLEGKATIIPVAEVGKLKKGFYLSTHAPFLEKLITHPNARLKKGWRNAALYQIE